MDFMMHSLYEIAQMEHAERMREADRFRRAVIARQERSPRTAAHKERRISFSRFPFIRPSEA